MLKKAYIVREVFRNSHSCNNFKLMSEERGIFSLHEKVYALLFFVMDDQLLLKDWFKSIWT